MEKMTLSEKEAMSALWKIGKGTARQILQTHSAPIPHYNTLRSTLNNLKKKKYLEVRPVGTTNEYIPIIKQAKYKKDFLSNFVKEHFENSYKSLVSFFAKEKSLSQKDVEEILDLIKKGKI
jgi:BlaI family penicillinase repressor